MAIGLDEKIDWFRVIVELCHRHGYTHSTISAAVGSPKSTIQGWKQGAAPKYEEGERLIDLWSQVTQNGRETVHRVKRHSHLA
jgi:hypothetical protein